MGKKLIFNKLNANLQIINNFKKQFFYRNSLDRTIGGGGGGGICELLSADDLRFRSNSPLKGDDRDLKLCLRGVIFELLDEPESC